MLHSLLLLATLVQAASVDSKEPDWIRLDDGRTLKGRVVYVTPERMRIQRGQGEVEVDCARVLESQTLEKSLSELESRLSKMGADDVGAWTDVARFCASRGLKDEARNAWLRILFAQPNNSDAIEGAGGRSIAGKTKLQNKGRWLDLDDYRAQKPKWKDAVELETTHFIVRTDQPLDKILDVALRAERHYLRFYDFLGPELGLYGFDPDEKPEIRIYSNEKDYPAAWKSGSRSWFAPGVNQLHVLVADERDMVQTFHDATDTLLFNAFRRSSGKVGQIPPWAVEGFSQYFAVTAGSHPGAEWAPLGQRFSPLFGAVTSDAKPLEIKQLLRSSHHEFRGGPDAPRRSAYAYALVHYLLHGDGGAHREPFFALLREAWNGKNIDNALLKSLDKTPATLQTALREYAQATTR